MPHFMIRINTIYEFIKKSLDKRCLFFKEYGAFIMKTRLFKYIENFTTKKLKIFR